MRYIDITKLKEVLGEEEFEIWLNKAKEHTDKIRTLSHKERSEYFNKNNDWTKLYAALSVLSNHKCWYSEAPENSSEWEIDHYRPKNRSKNLDGKILLKDGYWWLAYDWTNYRLTGSLVNKRRKDKFILTQYVKGKGDYFPLKLTDCTPAATGADTDYEVPYILDPTKFRDTTLIAFDKDGTPLPTGDDNTFDYDRALVSIEYLNLDTTALNRNRQEVWENCEKEIIEISKKIKNNSGGPLREVILSQSYARIKELSSRTKPYSSVARCCIFANSVDYPWLKNILVHLD